MGHTKGPWAWRKFGGRLVLVADYGGRKVVLASDRKGNMLTCDPLREENTLIIAAGTEPDMRLIESAPGLLKAAETVLAGLNARIDAATQAGQSVPVFDGIAALHDAIMLAGGDATQGATE